MEETIDHTFSGIESRLHALRDAAVKKDQEIQLMRTALHNQAAVPRGIQQKVSERDAEIKILITSINSGNKMLDDSRDKVTKLERALNDRNGAIQRGLEQNNAALLKMEEHRKEAGKYILENKDLKFEIQELEAVIRGQQKEIEYLKEDIANLKNPVQGSTPAPEPASLSRNIILDVGDERSSFTSYTTGPKSHEVVIHMENLIAHYGMDKVRAASILTGITTPETKS